MIALAEQSRYIDEVDKICSASGGMSGRGGWSGSQVQSGPAAGSGSIRCLFFYTLKVQAGAPSLTDLIFLDSGVMCGEPGNFLKIMEDTEVRTWWG